MLLYISRAFYVSAVVLPLHFVCVLHSCHRFVFTFHVCFIFPLWHYLYILHYFFSVYLLYACYLYSTSHLYFMILYSFKPLWCPNFPCTSILRRYAVKIFLKSWCCDDNHIVPVMVQLPEFSNRNGSCSEQGAWWWIRRRDRTLVSQEMWFPEGQRALLF